MDIKNLIDLLPPIFKAQDTSKVNGRGFLERYLEICGSYLTDVITPDIDNILEIIQIDTTPKEYLNYLWEFLGEIPFANIYNVDKAKWDLNYDGTNQNEDIWLIENNKPLVLSDETARSLIKYSLSLYKIRGTRKFFDTILRLYGMECTIVHDTPDYTVVTPYLDTSYLDKDHLDVDHQCSQCSNITIDLNGNYNLDGQTTSLEDLVNAYNGYEGKVDFNNLNILPSNVKLFVSLRRLFESFFDRFTPYNANVILKYGGILPDDNIKFDVLYEDPDNSIITKDNPTVNLTIVKDSKWPVIINKYQVSRDDQEWNGPYHTDDIYKVSNPGTYYFKDLLNQKIIPVSVGTSMIQEQYSLSIKEGNILYLNSDTATITPIAKLGNTYVDTLIEFPDGNKYNLKPDRQVGIIDSGKYKVYITNNQDIYTTVYVYDKPLTSPTNLVDLPYGVEVTVQYRPISATRDSTLTWGGPNSINSEPLVQAFPIKTNPRVISLKPWVLDPDDRSKVIYFDDTDISTPVCILYRPTGDKNQELYEAYIGAITDINELETSGELSISRAIEFMNEGFSLNYPMSFMVLPTNLVLSKYYDPYRVKTSSFPGIDEIFTTRSEYLHNPIVINSYYDTEVVSMNASLSNDSDTLTITPNLEDSGISSVVNLFILGAVLIDTGYVNKLWIFGENVDSDYISDFSINPNGSVTKDISRFKLEDKAGNTIRRSISVIGLDLFGLVNTQLLYLQDTISIQDGLYIDYGTANNWELDIPSEPLEIIKSDGTVIPISKIYTCKLDNLGNSIAKFKFNLVLGGIYFDSGLDDVILDDSGNSYNTISYYIKDVVKYYIPESDYPSPKPGSFGYIFSVKSFGLNPYYNIMLNIVIDSKATAGDSNTVYFTMTPEVFYLPSNGKIAITNMLASRPYNFEIGSKGVYIYGPLEDEDRPDPIDGPLWHNSPYEFIATNEGTYTFEVNGIVHPTSGEFTDSKEKTFTVYKNK